jgi:uncharacterized protein (TIGR00251 family)
LLVELAFANDRRVDCGRRRVQTARMSDPVREAPGGCLISIRVIPRARRSELAGRRGDVLLVRLAAPPVDGAANEALVDFLAAHFGISRTRVTLVSGERSRHKTIRLDGVAAATIVSRTTAGP